MAIMGFLAVANAYTMRVCLNIAITQMVRRRATSTLDSGSCPAGDAEEDVADPTVLIRFMDLDKTNDSLLIAHIKQSADGVIILICA